MAIDALLDGTREWNSLTDDDFEYTRQKGTDMRIGLDIASVAYEPRSLLPDSVGDGLLARPIQNRHRGPAGHRQHVLHLRSVRQPGSDQLRSSQDWHRDLFHHRRRRTGPLRRAGQRHCARRGHPAHRYGPAGATPEAPPEDTWTPMHPANISPFVAYLSTESCPIHGRVFFVHGGDVFLFKPFSIVDHISKEGFWTVEELQKEGAKFQEVDLDLGHPLAGMLWGGPPR